MIRTFATLTSLTLLAAIPGCHHSEKAQAQTSKASPTPAPVAARPSTIPAPIASAPIGGIVVEEATACRSVEDRAPVGAADTFPTTVGRIYVFTRLAVEGETETSIQHVWYFNETKMATVTLPARGSNWRTYSTKLIQDSQKGSWRVDVSTADGKLLKSVPFTIQ